MRFGQSNDAHLTYCTNVHPGESWLDVRHALETYIPAVSRAISPLNPFGVGLRLGQAAAQTLLENTGELEWLKTWLAEQRYYVFTLNGFPYGQFHGGLIKERVYQPNWCQEERLSYTHHLAHILAQLLPEMGHGSISTLPLGFKPELVAPKMRQLAAHNLRLAAANLVSIEREHQRTLTLAFEPEPWCALETSADAVAFFEEYLFTQPSLSHFASLTGLQISQAEPALRRHLSVCVDACHLAVMWERPALALANLKNAGITVGKVQISAGLEVDFRTERLAKYQALSEFAEGVYLHQVVEQNSAGFRSFLDLPAALASVNPEHLGDAVWRIHFHVPIHTPDLGLFRSTQAELKDLLLCAQQQCTTTHFEVETYTWQVLPEQYRGESVSEGIIKELSWVLGQYQ